MITKIAFAFFGLFAVFAVHAETWPPLKPPDPLALDWVIKQVLTRYPEVHAKHRAYLSALERAPQAGALDDPTLSVMIDDWSTRRLDGAGAGDADKMIELAQKFPARGKRALRAEVADRDADMVYIEANEHHLELQWQAQQAFYDYLLADQRLALAENQRRLWVAYTPAVKARSHKSLTTPRDLAAESARINTDLLRFARDRHSAIVRLNTLLSRNWEAPLTKPALTEPTELPGNREEMVGRALKESIATRTVAARISRANAAMKLAKKDSSPDFTVFGRYTAAGSDLRDDSVRLGVSVNLPLWAKQKQDHAVAQATHELGQWQEQHRAEGNAIVRDITLLHEAARTQRDALRYYEQDIVPRTAQLLNTATATYQAGRSELIALLDAYKAKYDVDMEALALRVDYEKSLTELNRKMGVLPEFMAKTMSANPLNSPRDPSAK